MADAAADKPSEVADVTAIDKTAIDKTATDKPSEVSADTIVDKTSEMADVADADTTSETDAKNMQIKVYVPGEKKAYECGNVLKDKVAGYVSRNEPIPQTLVEETLQPAIDDIRETFDKKVQEKADAIRADVEAAPEEAKDELRISRLEEEMYGLFDQYRHVIRCNGKDCTIEIKSTPVYDIWKSKLPFVKKGLDTSPVSAYGMEDIIPDRKKAAIQYDIEGTIPMVLSNGDVEDCNPEDLCEVSYIELPDEFEYLIDNDMELGKCAIDSLHHSEEHRERVMQIFILLESSYYTDKTSVNPKSCFEMLEKAVEITRKREGDELSDEPKAKRAKRWRETL